MAASKLGDKSRRELRREARLEKNKKKFDSWVVHQQSRKLKKSSKNVKLKKETLQKNTVVREEKAISLMDANNYKDNSSKKPHVLESSVVKLQSLEDKDFNVEAVRRKKALVGKSKITIDKFLDIDTLGASVSTDEDLSLEKKLAKKLKLKDGKLPEKNDDINILLDGIPSVLDSLGEGETCYAEEASGGELVRGSSCKKSQKHRSSSRELKAEKAGDPPLGVVGKSKKTMFEEYLQMDMQKDLASAEGDLALEKRLAKKLKVKEGKLRGDDDDLNMLFKGIPSVLDSSKNKEIPSGVEDPMKKSLLNSPERRKRKKRDKEHRQDTQTAADHTIGEPLQSYVEVGGEKVPSKSPLVEESAHYVAPHLRSGAKDDMKEYSHICRRVRGLLNRMSESNVEAITAEVSTIFNDVSRRIGSQIISAEVLAACSGGPRGNEQYAAVYAAFVAGMSCMVGIDFGAKLLASLARSFEDEYLKEDNLSMRNLTLLFSCLYIFGVCSSDLIFDFLMMLSNRLTEVDVSTILTILQCCGMKLRSDDAAAMKNFILNVQNRIKDLKSSSEDGQTNMRGKRMEFMLETICDIKNNKRRPKEESVQHTRIKKWLQKLAVDEILIRGLKWSKLIDPDKKGQWWLSGDLDLGTHHIEEVASKIDMEILETQKMLQLAAAQRMNTDARRAIFCIIMSGEDYIDTFEKLLRLDLPGKQDREIMRVILECCLQEKVFNKYYCLLASKLCSHDKNHKFTLQYCIWDHFKDLESMQLIRSMHLSKFIAEMLASYSISIAVLKAVDLNDTTQLTPKRIMHFRMLFEAIFEFPNRLIWNIFTRIAVTPEYEPLRSGIVFFISSYVISSQKSFSEKFKVAKKALNNAEGIIL